MFTKKYFRTILSIWVVIGLIALIMFVTHSYVDYVEAKQEVVTISEDNDKTLFFYRDDCADCQKIFHHVYWQNVFGKDIEFINMNQDENIKYTTIYDLEELPTFINGNQQYSGTDLTEIDKVIKGAE